MPKLLRKILGLLLLVTTIVIATFTSAVKAKPLTPVIYKAPMIQLYKAPMIHLTTQS